MSATVPTRRRRALAARLRWWLLPRLATELERHRYRSDLELHLEALVARMADAMRIAAGALVPVLQATTEALRQFDAAFSRPPEEVAAHRARLELARLKAEAMPIVSLSGLPGSDQSTR